MPLTCKMQVSATPSIDQTLIQFTLANQTTEHLKVLLWNTPWEGWMGRFIEVQANEKQLPYQGPMIKRASPQIDDFLEMKPQQQINNTLDLTQVYALVPGEYNITYTGMLTIQKDNSESAIQLIELSCPNLTFTL